MSHTDNRHSQKSEFRLSFSSKFFFEFNFSFKSLKWFNTSWLQYSYSFDNNLSIWLPSPEHFNYVIVTSFLRHCYVIDTSSIRISFPFQIWNLRHRFSMIRYVKLSNTKFTVLRNWLILRYFTQLHNRAILMSFSVKMTVILVLHHKMNSNIYINMSGKILNIYLTSDMCSDINSIYLTCKSNKMQPFDISSKDIYRSSYKNLYWNKLPVQLLYDS